MVLLCGSVVGLSRLARHSRLRFADRAEISFDRYLRPSGWELQLFARRPKWNQRLDPPDFYEVPFG